MVITRRKTLILKQLEWSTSPDDLRGGSILPTLLLSFPQLHLLPLLLD